jgi:hypothetical protein
LAYSAAPLVRRTGNKPLPPSGLRRPGRPAQVKGGGCAHAQSTLPTKEVLTA